MKIEGCLLLSSKIHVRFDRVIGKEWKMEFFFTLIRSSFAVFFVKRKFRYRSNFSAEWIVVAKEMDRCLLMSEHREYFDSRNSCSLIDSFCRDAEWKIDPFLWTDNINIFGGKRGEENSSLQRAQRVMWMFFYILCEWLFSLRFFDSTNLEMDFCGLALTI